MCRILRVLEGSGRLNVSYFTSPEAQNVGKFHTFTRFLEAQGGKHPLGSVKNTLNSG